jgi:hypothetical protein
MNWLEFFAAVVDSLAWPSALVILVVLLREPISGLIPLLHRLRYKDLELEFGRRLEAAKSEAAVLQLPPAPSEALRPPQESEFIERISTLAGTSPRAGVLEAWRELEDAAASAARQRGHIGPKQYHRTPANLVRALRKSSQVDSGIISLLEDLRIMRNRAAHATDFALSVDSAMEFAYLAERVIEYFRSWEDHTAT